MILEIFVLFLALSVIGIVLGYYTGDEFYAFVGLFILFSLSVIIILGNLQYKTGVTYNATTIVNTYTSYNDVTSHWAGYSLALASGFGMFLLFTRFKLLRQKRNEEEM